MFAFMNLRFFCIVTLGLLSGMIVFSQTNPPGEVSPSSVKMRYAAIGCNLLVGYGSRSVTAGSRLLPILPLLISVAFMFIADIDSPRHGIIRVKPQNLIQPG
jgi:hypothetical protein